MSITLDYGNTLSELAEEFITNLKESNTGSEDMTVFFNHILTFELERPTPEILKSIEQVSGTPYNAFNDRLFKELGIDMSPVMLSWICSQCGPIPDAITTFIGLVATYFYERFPANATITLRWWGDLIGPGKLITFNDVHEYYRAAVKDGEFVYKNITKEELYVYESSRKLQ